MVPLSPGRLRSAAQTAAPVSWWFGALVVACELIASAAGIDSLGLAAAALIAPGFALSGLLPRAMRLHPMARAAAAPSLGLAATSLLLISIAKLGIPLSEVSVRVAVVALVLAGLLVPRDREPQPAFAWRASAADGIALAAVLALAVVLGWRVIGTLPVPGDDWAKYLLYADEIRRHGSLLLENNLWMGGRPFSEDPGVPSLEGAALLMTGAPAGALVHVIFFLMLAQIAASFAAARAYLGLPAAIVSAGLMALVPATQNILGWHGLANVGALAILALVLAQLGAWLAGGLDRRAEIGLAITLIGVAAAHRLTAVFMVGTLGLVILASWATPQRRALTIIAARTLAITVVLGFVVVLDLQVRAGQGGGTLPYTSYLGTKVDLSLALRDITPLLALAALFAVAYLGGWLRALPRVVWPALGLVITSILLTYAWVFHLPLYYSRTVFFLPIALGPLAGAGMAALWPWLRERSAGWSAGAAILATAAVAATFVMSWNQADKVRDYYGFASTTALRGLDQLSPNLRPGEIVATDRCWSFLATWLLYTRTYPALEEQDIQPKAELLVARKAAAILRGTAEGRRVMRDERIRWALLDPTCPVSGQRFLPPGTVRFASKRLAIIELDPDGKAVVFPKVVKAPKKGQKTTPTPKPAEAPENVLP